MKQGSLLCPLSWRRKKVGRPPVREPANVTSNNGKPLVPISETQNIRTGSLGLIPRMSGYAALTRIWTPPVLPARMLDDKGVDCSRISGLLVGRSGPGHDELSARLLLIDLACSRHIGFERVFRRRFDRFVIGDSCWAIVRKRLLLKQSSHKNALGAWPLQAGCAGLAWPCSGS